MSSDENNSFTRATREGQREFDLGNFEAADHFFRLALDEAEKACPNFSYVATSLNNLAALKAELCQYDEAEHYYKRALVIKNTNTPFHPTTAICLANLAHLYCSRAKYSKAERLFRKALVIGRKTLNAEDPTIATFQQGLAMVFQSQGKNDKAEK